MFHIPTPPRTITMTATHGDVVAWAAGAFALVGLLFSLRPVRS
jgi:hypothetical protein